MNNAEKAFEAWHGNDPRRTSINAKEGFLAGWAALEEEYERILRYVESMGEDLMTEANNAMSHLHAPRRMLERPFEHKDP